MVLKNFMGNRYLLFFFILLFSCNKKQPLIFQEPEEIKAKEKITIKELVDKGYQLTHTANRKNALYLIFQKDSKIYSCAGNNSMGYDCWHLTDGK